MATDDDQEPDDIDELQDVPEYVDEPNICTIVLDTETTGAKGLNTWSKEHQVVQIACLHLQSRRTLCTYIKPPKGVVVPGRSTNIHKMGNEVLYAIGLDLKDGLLTLKDFVKEVSKPNDQVVIVAHNAMFDKLMITKSLASELDEQHGLNFVNHPWLWFDTLSAMRKLYSDIEKDVWPDEQPFKLDHLMKRFYPFLNLKHSHNAMIDVAATSLLFINQIRPRLNGSFLESRFFTICELNTPRGKSLRLKLISDVPGFAAWRTRTMLDIYNEFMNSQHEYARIRTVNCFTVYDMMVYGFLKYKSRKLMRDHEAQPWYGTLREVEIMLRSKPFSIYSDTSIVSLLSHIADMDVHTFVFNTMRDGGKEFMFPCTAGEYIAYLPLVLSPEDAIRVKDLGYKSMNEIASAFLNTADDLAEEKLRELNATLSGTWYTLDDMASLIAQSIKYT